MKSYVGFSIHCAQSLGVDNLRFEENNVDNFTHIFSCFQRIDSEIVSMHVVRLKSCSFAAVDSEQKLLLRKTWNSAEFGMADGRNFSR